MDEQTKTRLRALLIEMDKGIMMQHSAINGMLRMLEKNMPIQPIDSPNTETSTIAGLVESTQN